MVQHRRVSKSPDSARFCHRSRQSRSGFAVGVLRLLPFCIGGEYQDGAGKVQRQQLANDLRTAQRMLKALPHSADAAAQSLRAARAAYTLVRRIALNTDEATARAQLACLLSASTDPQLIALVEAWPTLPPAVKGRITALLKKHN